MGIALPERKTVGIVIRYFECHAALSPRAG
jgi:hypothetical protein